MSLLKNITQPIWEKLIITGGVLCVLLPNSPLNMSFATRDSGVFLYTGWRILQGDIPYRDVWDHKPPIVFYINALGLSISGNSRWGVWLIEFICVFLAAYIGFQLIKKNFGVVPAIISLFLWLRSFLEMNPGGNFTETYALFLQFICLWLVCEIGEKQSSHLRWFLVGTVGAIAFFTKQTTIGIIFAIILYFSYVRLSSGKLKQWFYELFLLFSGCLLVCVGIALFFYLQGALPQFWDAAFKYNFIYIAEDSNFPVRSNAIYGLLRLSYFTRTGLFYFSVTGYIFGLIYYKKHLTKPWLPLLTIGLLDLPIEWLMVSSSGRFYEHYYITLLPILSLFAGFALWGLVSRLLTLRISKNAINALLIGGGIVFLYSSLGYYNSLVYALANVENKSLTNYIEDSTSPGDYILMWGAESSVNYFTNRKSPTRFVYQYPLYTQGYVEESMILEFLNDVIQNRPKIIIDTQNISTPLYNFPIETKSIRRDIAYINLHYQRVGNFENWIVYKYSESTP